MIITRISPICVFDWDIDNTYLCNSKIKVKIILGVYKISAFSYNEINLTFVKDLCHQTSKPLFYQPMEIK